MENLIDLQTGILLKKFGSGNHKPGSGSAVALQGMLAAQMIRTVIDLTKGKDAYKHVLKDLEIFIKEIETIIYPALTELIQEDSIQFGKAIEARIARDEEKDIELRSQYAKDALDELKVATDIPVDVAKYGIRLTEIAIYLFDYGFQAARGDSSVAINSALAAVSGCLAIINLNLLSFRSDEWTIKMRNEADLIMKTRDKLSLEENDRQQVLKEEADQMHKFYLEINNLQKGKLLNDKVSYSQIEKLVSDIQNAMWQYRDSIWKKDIPESPFDIIDAKKLLQKLGYQYDLKPFLDIYAGLGGSFEVAGIIDSENKHVSISKNFPKETINFTIAHELGHAVLHPNQVLHRDRPMDGSTATVSKDYKELQANKFASCFLMPKKLVSQQFKLRFSINQFEINTQTAVSLGMRLSVLRANCKNARDLSLLIASSEQYNGNAFISLAKRFQVSVLTMAIRLEELSLIKFA